MSNSQLNKLKPAIKNWTEGTLNLSSNLIENSNNETNFPLIYVLLTDTQVSKIHEASTNGSSANIKFSKLNCLRWYNQEEFLVNWLQLYHKECFYQEKSIKNSHIISTKNSTIIRWKSNRILYQ